MEAIKRKRVTRVGSGAYSIYLPKKWIDTWAPNESDNREVDLHRINAALLIVPAHVKQEFSRTVADHVEQVSTLLLSAYLRGIDNCQLTPEGGRFSGDAVAAARNLLRHLDERLIVSCQPTGIGFTLDPDLPPPASQGSDILRVMGAKVRELLVLTAEAVDTYGVDPDRCLHAMRLLHSTQTEDVQRLLYQSVRLVARIELPMESVSDFQFLDLIASDLERIGGHTLRIVETILEEYGLALTDLEYPREHLLEKIGTRRTMTGLAREMVVAYRSGFEQTGALMDEILHTIALEKYLDLPDLVVKCAAAQKDITNRMLASVAEHWGQETDDEGARAAFAASKISSLLSDMLHALQSVARHALILGAATEQP